MMRLILLLALLLPSIGEAATLYVNNSGSPTCSDSTAKASNNAANPWCTIGRAAWGNASRSSPSSAEAADAGDTVLVTPGTYSGTGTGSRYDMLYNSYNSGTAGNPITYQCTTARGCELTLSSGTGAVIGACGNLNGGGCTWGAVDYITWDGFLIDEANAPSNADTGAVVFWHMTGGKLLNSTIDGNGSAGTRYDNHTGVRIEGCESTTIKNNLIHDVTNGGTPNNFMNGAGIEIYNSYANTIEHNEIYNIGSGIFAKALVSGTLASNSVFRYNKIYNYMVSGIVFYRTFAGSYSWDVYQNLIYDWGHSGAVAADSRGAIFLWQFDSDESPFNVDIVNNTIYNDGEGGITFYGGMIAAAGNRIYNNIVAGSAYGLFSENIAIGSFSTESIVDIEHNVYYNNTGDTRFNGTTANLATWKSTTSQDSAAPAASTSDPVFVNAAAYNFRLQGSSPFLSQGVDILDLDGDASTVDNIPAGAYITGNETIGIETSSSPSSPISGGVRFIGIVRIR